MLVLGRRENETVRVGNDIEVTVVAIHDNYVRLGFKAPAEISVLRTELINKTDKIPGVHFNGNEILEH